MLGVPSSQCSFYSRTEIRSTITQHIDVKRILMDASTMQHSLQVSGEDEASISSSPMQLHTTNLSVCCRGHIHAHTHANLSLISVCWVLLDVAALLCHVGCDVGEDFTFIGLELWHTSKLPLRAGVTVRNLRHTSHNTTKKRCVMEEDEESGLVISVCVCVGMGVLGGSVLPRVTRS